MACLVVVVVAVHFPASLRHVVWRIMRLAMNAGSEKRWCASRNRLLLQVECQVLRLIPAQNEIGDIVIRAVTITVVDNGAGRKRMA